MPKKELLIGVIGIAVVAVGAWFYFTQRDTTETGDSAEVSDTAARVNGEVISRTKLVESEAQIASGRQLDIKTLDNASLQQLQTQALDSLVGNTLIKQATAAAGIVTSEADVDAELAAIKARFADDAAYQQALTDQATTEAELRSEISAGKAAQTYLEQTLDLASITVTEEEISELYDQQATTTADLPPLEEVRDQIESYTRQQKQQELIVAHVAVLRAAANVEILI